MNRNKYSTTKKLLITFFASFSIISSIAVHFLRYWNRSLSVQVLILIIGIVLLFYPVYYILFRIINVNHVKENKFSLLLVKKIIPVLLISCGVYFLIPITMFHPPSWIQVPLPPTEHELQIISSGQKNENSLGDDIHLLETRDIDGTIMSVTKYQASGEWHPDGNGLINTEIQPGEEAILTYKFYGEWGKTIELLFRSGNTSGVVEIFMDGNRQVVDLYNTEEGESYINLTTSGSLMWKIILSILDIFSISFLIYCLLNIFLFIDIVGERLEQISRKFSLQRNWISKHIEWFLLVIITGAIWFIIYQYAGGPSAGGIGGNDNIWYLYNAMFPKTDASGLNRFVYIYILKLFIFLAHGDPFNAVKLSWSFWIAGTAALVYANTRLIISSERNFSEVLKGILAVVLFLSMPTILTLQTSLADHPLMFMVMLCILLFLMFIKSDKNKSIFIVLFGILFFLTFKIKESCLPLLILIAGLGFDGNGFNWKQLLKQTGYFMIGILGGLIITMALDLFILGDAFFGFRLANWATLVDTNVNTTEFRSDINWYSFLTYDNRILIVFLLSLVSLSWLERNRLIQSEARFVWLLPLGLILFMSLTIIASEWNILYRYMMWSLPIFCFLSVQFFQFKCSGVKESIKLLFFIVSSFCIVWFISYYYVFPIVESNYHWDAGMFHNAVMMPMAFTILISVVIIFNNYERYDLMKVLMFCCLFFILYPSNYIKTSWQDEGTRLMNREWAETSELVYTPYKVFSPYIDYSGGERVFISDSIFDNLQMLSNNTLFNHESFSIYYRIDTEEKNFYSGKISDLNELNQDYDYMFLYEEDMRIFSESEKNDITENYKVFHDSNENLILLKMID